MVWLVHDFLALTLPFGETHKELVLVVFEYTDGSRETQKVSKMFLKLMMGGITNL